ncbi:MAG: hypothetical protein ACYCOX_06350 [Acidobacteriaceae bacterium]
MNSKPAPVTKRVTRLIELCRDAIHLTERITQFPAHRTPEEVALRNERHAVSVELNSRLSKYRWSPVVLNSMTVNSYFHIHFVAGPNPVLTEDDRNAPSSTASLEHTAVEWIVGNIGAVHRIRRCHRSQCRKWFFAVRDHQKYCGHNCRQADNAQGESFKEKRRTYMSDYRKKESGREARAKQLAGGKSK